jgi:hypothetical protein
MILIIAALGVFQCPLASLADTIGAHFRSLEWLVDSSDVVLIGEKLERENAGHAYQVQALMKCTRVQLSGNRVGNVIQVDRLHDVPILGKSSSSISTAVPPDRLGERSVLFLRASHKVRMQMHARISLDVPRVWRLDWNDLSNTLEYFAVKADGTPIGTAVEFLTIIRERIHHGASVPRGMDRRAVELRKYSTTLKSFRWCYTRSPMETSGNDACLLVLQSWIDPRGETPKREVAIKPLPNDLDQAIAVLADAPAVTVETGDLSQQVDDDH